jgi:GNAT superfamily N-acetyltransferase
MFDEIGLEYFWTEHRDCSANHRKFIVFGQEYGARTCFEDKVVKTVCACVVELMPVEHGAWYTAFLYNFAATPPKHGFGTQLMNQVIAWCRDKSIHNVSAICLEVNTHEAHLAGFYRQFGFMQKGNDYNLVNEEVDGLQYESDNNQDPMSFRMILRL